MAYTLRKSFFVFFALLLCAITALSDDESYAKILIKFKSSLSNTSMLNNWIEPVENLCSGYKPSWTGLVCDNGTFTGIKLESMGLKGTIDVDSLTDLPLLSLSLMNNNFSGPFPYNDLKKLGKLRSLYLANNRFNGDIPDDAFSGMKSMRKLVLGFNEHTGKIPMSLLRLPRLVNLLLQNNQIEGRIPDLWQKNLTVNFANNKLEGPIPSTLSSQSASSFSGKRSPNQPGLDWPTRLKIIKGVARGLAYLYEELPSLSLPHGHLKSSNVLLDSTFEPVLSDYALIPVINKEHAQRIMVAYKSPESTQSDHVTRKTDVWSLGILILELLTGRFPANYLKQGREPNADLATWVNSVVREEWTGEIFDKDMNLGRTGEGQMLRLLKIGMCCCEWNVDRRWDLKEAIEKIEELKERDSDDDYSSYASEGEMYSSRAPTDEHISFSKA
ncbi:probable LRR receptor-like serine/threonine-protein kinase At4g31250 [Olea europaea var. sylvestris]|uniref:probable LRR receptor-like serine/threonine-protein kinase At4g31250 n=1 Tax=Olea europaea var. sylvestris TaxID=158386 RepID=UPI000C1CEC21|nr:probable LRR receptor-like serine/threonine-protein kinase At4g31250 [Olea europaea var. sylvestris]